MSAQIRFLKGAPQFIVLSLVVVFAAYLRQLSSGAVELRNKIVGGEIWSYPPDCGYSFVQDKIEALDKTADILSVVGPLLIWLAVLATIRIGFDGVSKFVSPWRWIPSLLVWFDLGIAIAGKNYLVRFTRAHITLRALFLTRFTSANQR